MTISDRLLQPEGHAMGLCRLVSGLTYVTILWAFASLPLVTLPPATTAALAALHRWNETGEPPAVRPFLADFGRHQRPSYGLGLVVLAGGLGVWFDATIVARGRPLLLGATLVLGVVLSAIAVQIAPSLLASTSAPRVSEVLIEAVRRTVQRPGLSLALVLMWVIVGAIVLASPHSVAIVVLAVLPAGAARVMVARFAVAPADTPPAATPQPSGRS